MEHEQFYRGHIGQVNETKRTSVRIFVSSTFTDTVEERDLLIGSVYPALRQYCLEKYNVQFQYADMRWGIQAQADNDHSTEELCFQELDRCCQFSLATNCVVLLSHRYGTRMVPARIPQEIFQALESVLSDDDRKSINEVYQLDENPLDAVYLLRPIDPAKRDKWDSKQKPLQKMLRHASDLCYQNKTMSENDRDEFHISVTAKEIYRALKLNEHESERMVVFFRQIEDIDTLDATVKKKFIDSNNEAQNLFDQTKADIRAALSQQNIYTYSVHWNDPNSKAQYMATFRNDFTAALKRQIDYHLSQHGRKNALYDEVLEHAIQCKRLQKQYFPRPDIMDQIRKYVLAGDEEQPCTIYGESGTGKSSIMAQVAIQASSWCPRQEAVSVIIRFLGATPSTSDIRRPLTSVIEQICAIYRGLPSPTISTSQTIEDIRAELENFLKRIPKDQILILLLDSIDQLQPEDYDCSKWLPTTYPSNVKCILSTIPAIGIEGKQYLILEGITSLVGNRNMIEVLQFNESLAKEVFNFWLNQDRRRLTPIQWAWIWPKLSKNGSEPTPLFLSLLYDITAVWHSFDHEVDPNFITIETTVGAIEYLYARLDRKHGEIIFRRALTFLWASDGLNEIELEDMLTADNEVLQTVFAHYLPPMDTFRLPSTLWIRIRNDISKYLVEKEVDDTTIIYFYHRSFQNHAPSNNIKLKYDIVRQAYFAGGVGGYPTLNDQLFPLASTKLAKKYGFALNNDNQCLIKADRHLTPQQPYIKYIKGQGRLFNMRRINQLIKHTIWTTTWDLGFLFDYQFLISYFSLYKMKYRLLECYANSSEVQFLLLGLNAASMILDDYPDNVAFEMLRQWMSIADALPIRSYKLLQQCQNRSALCPQQRKASSTVKYILGTIRHMQISTDVVWILLERTLLVFYCAENRWLTARHIEYDLNSSDFTHISCSLIFVCVYSNRSIQVFGWNMHELEPALQLDVNEPIHVTFVEGKFLIVCSRRSQLIEVWNCLSRTKIETFSFQAPLRHCTTVIFSRRIMRNVAVTQIELDSNEILYLKLVEPIDPNSDQNRFKLCRSPNNRPGKKCIVWKANEAMFYDEGKTFVHLNEFSPDSVVEKFDRIDHLPPLTHVECVNFSKLFETAVVWFTDDKAMILHKCNKCFTIPGAYHDAFMESYVRSGIADAICFYNRIESKFSFFQLNCSQHEHQYRELGHLQLEKPVQYCGWRCDARVGLVLYCILNQVEFHTYYITVLSNLPKRLEIPNGNSEITQFDKVNHHHIVAFNQTKKMKLFRMFPNPSFISQFQLSEAVSQVTMNTSHMLLVDSDNSIFVYTLDDATTTVFNTNRFQFNVIRVYSLSSVFYIVDGTTSDLFVLNVQKPLQLEKKVHLKFSCRTLVTSLIADQPLLCILSEDQSTVAMWNSSTETLSYSSLKFDSHVRVKRMYALPLARVFCGDDRCVYVQMKGAGESIMNCGSSDLVAIKTNLLALFDRTEKRLTIYDLETKQRGERHPNVSCDTLCFTDNGKYLFGISLDESTLFMYDVHTGKRLERLFIEDLSSSYLAATSDLLIMNCREKLSFLSITGKDSALLADREEPPQRCLLFEKRSWFDCYDDVPWVKSPNLS